MSERRLLQPLKKRSKLRLFLGKEYFILKRKLEELKYFNWAKPENTELQYDVFSHKSFILKQLKNVDMYLQYNKITNLQIAIDKLNNTVINPGEIFSFWKPVGRPTKQKGYLEGLVLEQGKISKGIGGGLCQLGNLLFWIFAHSPLDIIERYRHSYDVFPDNNRQIPFGSGATLVYNYLDLKVKNNSDIKFQIKLWIDGDYLYGKLLSDKELFSNYEIVEKEHKISQQIWGAYSRHNRLFKIEKNKNGIISEKLLVENHALLMYEPFLGDGTRDNP